MRFYDTRLLCLPREGFHVQWRVEPENDDLAAIELEIQRSESPRGPWEVVAVVDPATTFTYTDVTAPWRPKNWSLHYQLVGRLRATGAEVPRSAVVSVHGQLPMDALEIIRQHNLLLRGVNGHRPATGRACTVYKRRNFGFRCRACTDEATGQVVISQCRECGGTGFAGSGYYDAIDDVAMNINPNARATRLTPLSRLQDNETSAFMTNWPLMADGDIVVEDSERHWRVVDVQQTERQRVLVHQVLRLAEVDHNDVVYETLRHKLNRSL